PHAPSGTSAPAGGPPTPPARQVAPIAIALAFAPGPHAGFTLALEPAEMGRVEIRMRREGGGHALHIIAERPETLGLLQRDRQELNASLAQAGLRIEGQGVTFSLESGAGGQQGATSQGDRGRRPRTGSDPDPGAVPSPMQRHGLLDLHI
ncbi:MAG TPA: flagellar hook-length control protein FliK, partial [Roseococcus sp.]|nr:flagellar hook-length control protein FliK [Roseococcus sp.]